MNLHDITEYVKNNVRETMLAIVNIEINDYSGTESLHVEFKNGYSCTAQQDGDNSFSVSTISNNDVDYNDMEENGGIGFSNAGGESDMVAEELIYYLKQVSQKF